MQEIREWLNEIIKELYDVDFDAEITVAPENIEADYSTNAPLKLAKIAHEAPINIAGRLKEAFLSKIELLGVDKDNSLDEISKDVFMPVVTVSEPGFINFILPDEYFMNKIGGLAEDFAKNISWGEYSGKTVICEFSDPNPFKILHVGHLYTSIVGDAISRLYEYAGAKVVRANFGGDVGLHVAKTMYALQRENIVNPTIEDIADCYVKGTADYEENEDAKQKIVALNKQIYRINQKDEHDSELAKLYWYGRELSYEYFKDFYAKIGIKFDKYYPESTVAELGLTKVKEQLEKGVYKLSDGAVIFDGEKYGLHTRVFINKDGVPTYEAKDVGLIFTKWQDYHFDKSVVITGNEQLDYMKVVLKSVEQYAPDLVEKTSHLTHGLVKLPGNVKMSSRKGNFLKAVEVLDMVRDALKAEYNSTDEKVYLSAVKYAFIKYKMGGNIVFDPHDSVKMTGNSGPYLLYSCVRAKKILASVNNVFGEHSCRRGGYNVVTLSNSEREGVSQKNIIVEAERNLAKKILEYKDTLQNAVFEMAPHKLANYLYELAQEFSRFYENCPVAGSEREPERLQLVKVYLDTMAHGLDILGINIPEEM
ncbi:arginine--tRNA ligase [Candidatus Saccharibacteria bacterium]|nr:arginine--tRNA ligase [Candidatus Saccharibacteria bacterium]